MNAQEHYKTENEMQDELTESYGEITCGHLTLEAGRLFREFDEPFFNACIAESLQWECEDCGKVYDDEDSASECCDGVCEECGKKLTQDDQDDFGNRLIGICSSCFELQQEEDEEEDEEEAE